MIELLSEVDRATATGNVQKIL